MAPKFRAWLKEEKKMVDVEGLEFVDGKVYSTRCKIDGVVYYYLALFALMQSTGLKDINGKEIYEGDVVLCEWGEIGDNVYTNAEKTVVDSSPHNLVMLEEADRLQILGNIYENPELLEEVSK